MRIAARALLFALAVACAFLLVPSMWLAGPCTLNSGTYLSWISTTGQWTGSGCTGGSYLPTAPDTIIVPATATLHIAIGESVVLSTNSSGVGDAFTVQATNSSTFGSLYVDAGATLTVRGFDNSTNRLGQVNRFAHLEVAGTIIGGPASGAENLINCDGLCHIAGSSGAHAVLTNETANWNNAGSTTATSKANTAGAGPSTYFAGGNVYVWLLSDLWLANSGGTALGSSASSSVAFSSQSCTPTCSDTFLTVEVSRLDLVTSTGKYYIDYRSGIVWWWMDSGEGKTVSFTANYKKLSFTAWRIASTSSSTFSELTVDYTDGSYMGRTAGASGGAYHFANKNMAGTSQRGSVTNSRCDYCERPVAVVSSNGASGNPIVISDNYLDCGHGSGGFEGCVWMNGGSYISVLRNRQIGGRELFTSQAISTSVSNFVMDHNVVQSTSLIKGVSDTPQTWPDGSITKNAFFGCGTCADSRAVGGLGGTSGHRLTFSGNLLLHAMRAINVNGHQNLTDNTILFPTHHGFSANFLTLNVALTGITVSGQVVISLGGPTSMMDFGYNHGVWIDAISANHNTLTGTSANFLFTDRPDNVGPNLLSNFGCSNNLITGGSVGVQNSAATSSWMQRLHLSACDWNVVSGNTTNYSGWTQFATVTGLSNVLGVSLFNPSATLPISGKTLAWTYTSATNTTLTWDGGTPVQLVLDSGTATAATNSTNNGTLTDSGKTFATAQDNASTPIGCWLKITGGTGSGQIRRILATTATQMTVAPAWTTTPDATSTYSIVKSEVTLTAGDASTVQAGIDYQVAATSTQSDTAVAISTNSASPTVSYAYSSGSLALWDLAKGGTGTEWSGWLRLVADPTLIDEAAAFIRRGFTPSNVSTWCGGSDGETIGAQRFCAQGKAMIGALQ